MRKDQAIQRAGGPKALADLLGITPSAISQWEQDVPKPREWQLRVLKPEWFNDQKPTAPKSKKPRA